MSTINTSPRAANKAARELRRDEITQRWNERAAIRMFLGGIADQGGLERMSTLRLIDDLLHYGTWASRRKLILASGLSQYQSARCSTGSYRSWS